MAHLNYGGTPAKKSKKLGSKPAQGAVFKTQKRLETIVRLENAGFSETAVAGMVGVSKNKLSVIKRSREYLNARVLITHNIILDYDGKLADIKEQRREILTQNLPSALQALAEEIQRPALTVAERKLKTTVALEILDREGTFAKVSRTEIKPVESFDFEKADKASSEIIAALSAVPRNEQHTKIAIEANNKFSNSHTLSQVDQQAALDELEKYQLEEVLSFDKSEMN